MFCRFCGAHVLEDSLFCAKCGKKLGRPENPRWEKVSSILRLRTPYPYAILLILGVVIWAATPQAASVDYNGLKWTFELNRKLDLPNENLFQQSLLLVLENVGSKPVKDVPVDFAAHIEPPQPADIAATFLGNRLTIMSKGKALPLTVILGDEVRPGSKRSYLLEGSIQAQPPFKVTFEVLEEGSDTVLTNFVVER
ncbi:MAG TPA: zinc ribbon domain-containing protein [Terriglobia bacterium]|nr:zinc ribbon domain-containing protein [Terriglobia bacterium]